MPCTAHDRQAHCLRLVWGGASSVRVAWALGGGGVPRELMTCGRCGAGDAGLARALGLGRASHPASHSPHTTDPAPPMPHIHPPPV